MIDVRAEKWSASEQALAEALVANPEFPKKSEAFFWRGVSALKCSHEAKAEEFLSEAVKGSLPLDQIREAKILLADIRLKSGRADEAKRMYISLLEEGASKRMSAEKLFSIGTLLAEDAADKDSLRAAKLAALALESAAQTDVWRQQAALLAGLAEEKLGNFAAAITSYEKGFSFKERTETAKTASYSYGVLLRKAEEYRQAEKILSECVSLNQDNPALRAAAYLELAELSLSRGDLGKARSYSTVVVTLFNEEKISARAREILSSVDGKGMK
jgi:tetratricopeptide (TPR) repeat protein